MGYKTLTISGFEQGGFYVDSGDNYNSSTEVRSGWIKFRPMEFTLYCGDNEWSFICCDSNGNAKYISLSLGYKASGTTIDLSSYDWVAGIRIELNNANGLSPPASCDIVYRLIWEVNEQGEIENDQMVDVPEHFIAPPYPDALWRIDGINNDGYPFHYLLPDMVRLNNQPLIWIGEKQINSVFYGSKPIVAIYYGKKQIL